MASQIIALANRWGTHFGGINTFNTGLMKALGQREDRDDFKLICIVESATEDEKAQAESSGVCLLESGANMLLNSAEALEAVARLVDIKTPALWLGHDDKTGPLALDLREKLGGKVVLFNHMAHIAYQGFKKGDSLKADEKKELQRKLFLQADHAISVGPRLHAELTDLLSTSPRRPTVTMLMPGLDAPSDYEVEYRDTQPLSFRGFAAGRLGLEDDRIKQGRLAIRGFVEAVEDQKTTGKLRMLARTPRICLMGVEKDQESELRPKLEEWTKRQLQVELIPFTADRQKYFHELASSSFAMMLSWHEGFGLVGWEAIAARVPLILGKNSGLWQFLEDKIGAAHVGQCIFPIDIRGHLADEDNNENHRQEDVEAVKDAIEKLAASGDDAKKAAISLYDLIVEKGWTWQRAATDFIACVEPLLALETLPGHTDDSAQVEPLRENSADDDSAEDEDLAEKTNIASLRNPFKGDLTHWTTDDDKPLPGRKQVIKDIVAAMANSGDFILLRGRSGCGKSSLMQNGVMRKLREIDGSVLVPFRPTELMAGSGEGDALDKLANLIAEASSIPFTIGGPAAMRASNYAKRLRTSIEDNHITLVLGLDQFEEIIDVLKLERDRSTGTPLSGWWLVIHFLKALCSSPNIRLIATLESAREQSFLDLCIGEAIGLMPKTVNVDATDDTVGEIAQSGFSQGGLPLDSTVIEAIKIKWRAFEHDASNSHASPLPLACLFFHRLYERFADLAGATADERLENAFLKAGKADRDHLLTLEEIGGEDAITFADIIQNLADAAWREAEGNSDFADPIETDEKFGGLNNFLKPLVMVDRDGQIQLRAVTEADADDFTRRQREAFRKRRLLVPETGIEQPRLRPVHQALFDRWSPANRWLTYRREKLQIVQRFREDAAYWHQRDKLVPLESDGSTLRAAALTLQEHLLDWTQSREPLGRDDATLRDQALAVFDTAIDPLAVLEGSPRGETFAHLAANYHRVDLLKRFFADNPESVNVEDQEGRNLIHSSAWSNGPAVLFLIAQGIPLKTEKHPWHAITVPIMEHLNDNFDAMISQVGLDDIIETSREHRMIHLAALYGNRYVIERLTQQDANLSIQNKYKQTALHYAAERDQVDAFRYLLPHIDIQKSDYWERTAISSAARFGADRVLTNYLAEEVNKERLTAILRHRDNQGDTPLMNAARYRQAETLRVLLRPDLDELSDPSSPMHQSEDGDTLFHCVFRGSFNEAPTEEDRFRARTLVEILLRDRRLHPNQANNKGETPFDLGGDFPEARRVLRQDERVPNDYAKMTPVMRFEDLSSRRPATVLRLIKEAPQALTDTHEQASGGETGLEILIRLKNHKVLATLTEDPSHWPMLRKEFQKLLTVAAVPAAEGLRASLQRRFTDGEINTQEAGELLGVCIDAADVQTAADLVQQGVPLSLRRDNQGSTVLHRAAITGDSERFRSVLAIGSFTVPLDQWGRRPSDLATEQNVAKFRALEESMKDPTNNTASSALSSSIVGAPPFLYLERTDEARTANEREMALLRKEWQKEWGNIDALDISVFNLPFHPNVPLIELRPSSSISATGRICFLLGTKKLVLLKRNKLYRLNGTSPPIHEVNANQQPLINEKTVLDYLAFFCFFVRGEDGPFFIVDSQDNEFLPDLGQLQSEFEAAFRPPRVWGIDEQGNWRVSALVYYGDALFVADFKVQLSGMVEMLEDTLLLDDLPARIDAPLEIRTLQ